MNLTHILNIYEKIKHYTGMKMDKNCKLYSVIFFRQNCEHNYSSVSYTH